MKTVNNPGTEPREFAFNGTPYTLPVGLSEWPDDTAFFLQNRMKAQGVRIEWGDAQKGPAPEVPEGRDARRQAIHNAKVRSEAGEKERVPPMTPAEKRALARGEMAPYPPPDPAEEPDGIGLPPNFVPSPGPPDGPPAELLVPPDAPEAPPEHPAEALVSESPAPEPPAEQEEGSGSTEA